MSLAAIPLQICPRCSCLSLITDESPSGAADFCTTCGYFADASSCCDVPHFNFSYRWNMDQTELVDLPGEPDICNLDATELWLKDCEAKGFSFTHFVVVDVNYQVHWLRGSP